MTAIEQLKVEIELCQTGLQHHLTVDVLLRAILELATRVELLEQDAAERGGPPPRRGRPRRDA